MTATYRCDGGDDVGCHMDLPHVEVVSDLPAGQDVFEEDVGTQLVTGLARDPCVVRPVIAEPSRLASRSVQRAMPVDE